ncbi:MAG: RluA family pseudouridine synthase [Caldilineaceae bacterium]
MAESLVITVDPALQGLRLDRGLADALPDRSRSEVQRWIKEGRVFLHGEPAKSSVKLAAGDVVTIVLPEKPQAVDLAGEELPLSIVYEDDDLLVIDKPAGMVVHPAPGHSGGTLVNAVLHHCPGIAGVGGERRPGIVHRLDKDTSGLIVVAKHDQAMRSLQAQFKARTVFKEYLALLEGKLQPEHGRISAPIGRHPTERKRMAVLPPDSPGASDGREAVTSYRVLGVYTGSVYGRSTSVATFSLVSAVLHTGRTHQIRVHFAWLQHPVVGDTLYGFRTPRLPLERQFLHAHRLRLRLPSSGEEREFVAPLPPDLQGVLDELGRS